MSEDKITIEYIQSGSKKGKINKIFHDDYDFYFWDYEEQTKVKHLVFEEYFKIWSTKLGAYNNINYFDGFGGCGAYYDRAKKEILYGTPILAKQVLLNNK